jgi:hypothetical protein
MLFFYVMIAKMRIHGVQLIYLYIYIYKSLQQHEQEQAQLGEMREHSLLKHEDK